MSKYIVELKRLPKDCLECPLCKMYSVTNIICAITQEDANLTRRDEKCPIRIE